MRWSLVARRTRWNMKIRKCTAANGDGNLPLGLGEELDAVHRLGVMMITPSGSVETGQNVPVILCDMKSATVALPSFQA